MDHLQRVRELNDRGLFRDAFQALERVSQLSDKQSALVLKAELLERLGRSQESRLLIDRALSAKNVSWDDKSACDFVLAKIAAERGDVDRATTLLNKAITSAKHARNIERVCLGQLKLLVILSDGPTRDATGPLLAELRANAARSGSPTILAAVHVYFAQIEGYRSSVGSAKRHLELARRLLENAPNVWLEAVISNIELGLSLMASEFEVAIRHGQRGLELAEQSGGSQELAINRGNTGYAFQALGRVEEALACYERALDLLLPGGEPANGILDSIARVRLAQNRLTECEQALRSIDTSNDRIATFVARHVNVTRSQLAFRKGEYRPASQYLATALRMCQEAKDPRLAAIVRIEQAFLSLRTGHLREAVSSLESIAQSIAGQPAYAFARFQELLGEVANANGESVGASERARRIYSGLHDIEALRQVKSCVAVPNSNEDERESSVSHVFQSISAVLDLHQHPNFVGLELYDLFASSHIFARVKLLLRKPDQGEIVLKESAAADDGGPAHKLLRRLTIGTTSNGLVELNVTLKKDCVESAAVFHSLVSFVCRIHELRSAQVERIERSTLWPTNEFVPTGLSHVIQGEMEKQMMFAQRVARTTVNVLITGESGTGKEILARAIHDFSDRAHKPFVPFNCAAVPRDLVESQLFGYRRGAFTGADRDQLGLIRSATDGTLFLDEIGEMSVDLQPKLLRFLESGEIAPLGDPAPMTINVRLIAATNANLEDAVRDGRFREDLFYRLNVVRLTIKPLRERRDEIPALVAHFVAAAAREFKKGHLEVSEDTMERLLLYRWPGNVRQLQNEIRRMVALADPNSTLEPDAISPAILGAMPDLRQTGVNGREIAVSLHDKLLPTLARIEYEMIKTALREHHGKVEPAAKALGISRKGLYLKRQRLGL